MDRKAAIKANIKRKDQIKAIGPKPAGKSGGRQYLGANFDEGLGNPTFEGDIRKYKMRKREERERAKRRRQKTRPPKYHGSGREEWGGGSPYPS